MTDYTVPSGTVLYSSEHNSSSWQAWRVFDGNTGGTGWASLIDSSFPQWIGYQSTSAYVVTSYKFWCWENSWYPTEWKFQGSNNGTDWTDLDSQTGQSTPASGNPYTYNFSNSTGYTYHRFYCTAASGGRGYYEILEMEFIGESASPSVNIFDSVNTSESVTVSESLPPLELNIYDPIYVRGFPSTEIPEVIIARNSTLINNFYDYPESVSKLSKAIVMSGVLVDSVSDGSLRVNQADNRLYHRVNSTWYASPRLSGDTMTGQLVLSQGSTADNSAPLRFRTGGSLQTNIQPGSMEYANNAFYLSNLVVRRSIAQVKNVLTSTTTVANTTTPTVIYTVPHGAGYLQVGKQEDISIWGTVSSVLGAGANTLTITIKWGTLTIGTFVMPEANRSAVDFEIHVLMTVRAIGLGTTTIYTHCNMDIEGTTSDPIANALTTGLDSTVATDLTITATWSDAHATNSLNITQGRTFCLDNA